MDATVQIILWTLDGDPGFVAYRSA